MKIAIGIGAKIDVDEPRPSKEEITRLVQCLLGEFDGSRMRFVDVVVGDPLSVDEAIGYPDIGAATPQPPPRPDLSATDVQTLVIADIVKRREFGIAKYGTPLQVDNGRDALVDAYQEVLDLACYLRQEIARRRG